LVIPLLPLLLLPTCLHLHLILHVGVEAPVTCTTNCRMQNNL
jgi:hypothetical protein